MLTAYIVLVTVPNRREADRLASSLVGERLAACVSIVPGVTSHYRWKGMVEKSSELLLMMKTTRRSYARLEKRIKQLHSYSVPEILALPVAAGNRDYLKWLGESVKR